MSKELIDRLRSSCENGIDPDDIYLAASCIEELEREAAMHKEVISGYEKIASDLKADNALLNSALDNMANKLTAAENIGNALQADNVRLREAVEARRYWFETQTKVVSKGGPSSWELMLLRDERDACEEALAATPEQSLARIRNQVLDEAAKVCDKEAVDPHSLPAAIVARRCSESIRALKEPE